MATTLFDTPPVYDLPLSKGGDLRVVLTYTPLLVDDAGQPVLDAKGKRQFVEADWPVDAVVSLVIDSEPPVSAVGVITGSQAAITVDHLQIDDLKSKLLWRAVFTHSDDLDEVLANGVTVRADGRE